MTVTIERIGQVVANELLPVAITDPLELAVYDIPGLSLWLHSKHATMQGVVPGSTLPFVWLDRKQLTRVAPETLAGLGQAPIPMAEGARQFLRFGYGGAGLSRTANGTLRTPPGTNVIPTTATAVTMWALVRTPGPELAATNTVIIGNKVPHVEGYSASDKSRMTGIGVGFGGASLGKPRFMSSGDIAAASPPGTVDHRDNRWHFYLGVLDPVSDTTRFFVDGVLVTTATGAQSGAINTLAGSREFRVAAAGAADATAVVNPYVGDIASLGIIDGIATAEQIAAIHALYLPRFGINA